MTSMTRRHFLRSTALTAVTVAGTKAAGRVWGANDDIRVAVVGVNGRGSAHISEFRQTRGVRVAALCDVDKRVLEARAQGLDGVQKYQDIRSLLDNKDIDVVSIATPNHWHSLMTIW